MSSSHAPAVIPPPDGGYPGFNTAEGTKALQNLSSGVGNFAVGWYSLLSNSAGSYNTAVGAGTLASNNEDENTAIGAGALLATRRASVTRRPERSLSFPTPRAVPTQPSVL